MSLVEILMFFVVAIRILEDLNINGATKGQVKFFFLKIFIDIYREFSIFEIYSFSNDLFESFIVVHNP